MVLPPSSTGATNATDTEPLLRVPTRPVGGPEITGAGTRLFDASDGALVPTPFVAVAVHVYVLAFVNPLTTIGLPAPDAEPVAPPSDDGHVTR
jgi:hypothetical protein